jgi:hypothetical protein
MMQHELTRAIFRDIREGMPKRSRMDSPDKPYGIHASPRSALDRKKRGE